LSFLKELKRRNVFRVGAAYIIIAWLVAQVLQLIFESFGTPDWVIKTVLVLLAAGLPFSLFFAWAFEMTPEGIKREHEVDRSQSITPHTGKKLDRVIIGVLALSLTYFAYDKFMLSTKRETVAIESAVEAAASRALTEQAAIEKAAAESRKSIAVLPFINMSDDAGNEFFSDGLSEELLNLLAKIPELRVTSRSSAFSYKGKDFKITDVGRELNVSNVLEGSVRKVGNQVRITAQLIKVDGDIHLWSETYDRSLDNIFAIQDEIAAAVVAQLKLKLFADIPTVQETNPEAYAFFLQARHLSNLLTPEGWEQANVLFQKAIAIDPNYANSWAGLSRNYVNLTGYNLLPPEEGIEKALEAANQALAIDPENVMAYSSLGWVAMTYNDELAVAAQYYQRAMELEPTNLSIIRNSATLVMRLGRLNEATKLVEFATVRDPVNPVAYLNLSNNYILAERLDEAIKSARTALWLSPGIGGGRYRLGEALLRKGQPEEALAFFTLEEDEEWRVKGTALASYELDRLTEYEQAFAELRERWGERWPIEIAHVYAWIGDTDEAFSWLEKELEINGLSGVMVDNFFTSLHDDPRWQPLLEKGGVSPDQLAAIEFEVTLPN
jgi:TolB-like protein/Tfp pilus assembly protein PilF